MTVLAGDTWKVVRKKDGHTIITATCKLSQDGKTLTDDYTFIGSNGSTFNLNYVYRRTTGKSGFAGTWEVTSERVNSVFLLQVRAYKGDGLSFITPSEEVTKSVRFDGKDYPDQGPNVPPGPVSSGRRVNLRTLELTGKVNGKTMATEQIELSPDHKTLTMTVHAEGIRCQQLAERLETSGFDIPANEIEARIELHFPCLGKSVKATTDTKNIEEFLPEAAE